MIHAPLFPAPIRALPLLLPVLALLLLAAPGHAQEESAPDPAQAAETAPGLDEWINGRVEPISNKISKVVFWGPDVAEGVTLPLVVALLGGTAIFLTVFFKFLNLRGFGVAFRTARGKYTDPDAPGQITHFQALSAALSATVGLGNIAGVAVAVALGGPGATFWMIVLGLCGMTTKFAECTLGVKYRHIDKKGKVHGGAMYYLRDGLGERGLGTLGKVLAIFFALFVIGGAFGGGNMFQSNQAITQVSATLLPEAVDAESSKWIFGVVLAVLVALVILGGIVSIARVTSFLVPFMCGIYVLAALVILLGNPGEIFPAFVTIVKSAFNPEAVGGGLIGVIVLGIQRAAFSNEAGFGSAPIAHSAVKTDRPASEGFVALLEPFVDTVVVCTMTALVLVITGTWQINGEVKPDGAALLAAPGASETVRELEAGQFVRFGKSEEKNGTTYREVVALDRDAGYAGSGTTGWVAEESVETREGVSLTSLAFGSKIPWFPKVLGVAVLLFAFSTMISWSYYGEQGVVYLFRFLGEERATGLPVVLYKIVFCALIVVGASAELGNVISLADSMFFAMVVPNLVGIYLLLPVIRREAGSYLEHVKAVDAEKARIRE